MDKEKRRILIQRVQDLPTLPSTIVRIIELVEDPTSTSNDLAEVISKDQSISSVILRLVNSAFYGHMRQVSSISHAVVILGYKTVQTMALGVSIFHSSAGGKRSAFDRTGFWTHCIGVATISRKLLDRRKFRSGVDAETVFLSGLLHDLGKVVFDNYFNEEYARVVETAKAEKAWVRDIEERVFEMDHAEAGYYLARKWLFPSPVISAIRCHHKPSDCEDDDVCKVTSAIVHIADHLCRKLGIGSGGDDAQVALDPNALSIADINEEDLAFVLEETEKSREMIESFASDKK